MMFVTQWWGKGEQWQEQEKELPRSPSRPPWVLSQWSSTTSTPPRPAGISWSSQEGAITTMSNSTALSRISWCKAETQLAQEEGGSQFMAQDLKMKLPEIWNILEREYCPWLMQVLTQMAVNSSFHWHRHHGLMKNTLFLEGYAKGWMLSNGLEMFRLIRMIDLFMMWKSYEQQSKTDKFHIKKVNSSYQTTLDHLLQVTAIFRLLFIMLHPLMHPSVKQLLLMFWL